MPYAMLQIPTIQNTLSQSINVTLIDQLGFAQGKDTKYGYGKSWKSTLNTLSIVCNLYTNQTRWGVDCTLDEYEICSVLARAVPDLVDPPPLAMALRLHSRPPPRKLGIDAVAFTAATQRLTFCSWGADCAHLATWKVDWPMTRGQWPYRPEATRATKG